MSNYDPGTTSSINLSTGISSVAPGFTDKTELHSEISDEIKKLRIKNELWLEYAPLWDFYLAAYEGGPDIIANYVKNEELYKHVREEPHSFTKRANAVHYQNYCKPLVDFFTYFIFSETIQRNGGDDDTWYQGFIKNVNRKGENITSFMKMVSDDVQIFGTAFVLVDSPKNPLPADRVLSKSDEEKLNLAPYWCLIKPFEIVDWDLDDFENITYLKRCQLENKRSVEGVQNFEKYTEWFPDHIVITYVNVTNRQDPSIDRSLGSDVPNRLNEIPFEVIRFERSKRYSWMGNSFLRDFAGNNREVLHYTSLIQEFLGKQCFNMLAKESDSSVPLRDGNDGVIGSGNVLEYPKGSKEPKYVTPPVDPAKFLQSERQDIVANMFKRAAQDMMSELFNGEGASGFSQAQSFSKTVPFISNRADTLENAEVRLMQRTMKYMPPKKWTGKIKYKDRYEITNISDAINQLLMVFRDLMLPSPTFVKEELKRLVSELDGKLPPEILGKVMSEIEGMNFAQWQETQKEALVGQDKPEGSSPGAQQKPKNTNTLEESAAEARSQVSTTNKVRDKQNK